MLEHHFSQDIGALQQAGDGEVELDVMPYELLRSEALRVLPARVADGLEAFTDPELERARGRWRAVLREILEDRFTSAPFDAIVVPSDTFFYVRGVPAVAHALGVPFLVAQKETTIAEYTLREHAEQVRRFAPPQADRMTVCSQRHKRFWLRAGASEETVVVTGQPRFDFYSHPPRPPEGLLPGRDDEPVALFLSFATDAYHPDEGRGEPTWAALREQTEQGLLELARRGWRVLVKPHPQQPLDWLRQWRRRAGELWGRRVFAADAQADVRPLIAAADAVVGFQSTGLLEAMIAGRPVLYTGWDPAAAALEDRLIPFHRWEREIVVVRRPGELADAAAAVQGSVCSAATMHARRAIAEHYLGPIDGGASERTLAALRAEADHWAERRRGPERELRERLRRRRAPFRLGRRGRAWVRTARRQLGAALGRRP